MYSLWERSHKLYMKSGILTIAREAGLSKSTVSSVLDNDTASFIGTDGTYNRFKVGAGKYEFAAR